MRQRCFTFYAFTPWPVDSSREQVDACLSECDAVIVSLEACRSYRLADGRPKLQRVFAEVIGATPAYVSQVKRGVRHFPEWMVAPFCRFTGTNLLAQYRKKERDKRIADGRLTDNLRRALLAEQLYVAGDRLVLTDRRILRPSSGRRAA
jgi:hypothetical protein